VTGVTRLQFLVCGYDGADDQASERRLAARPDHVAVGDELVEQGRMLFGVALLDGDRMIGSVLVVDFPDRDELNGWLEVEPYVTGNVWQRVEITPCRVGPSFVHLLSSGTAD